MVGAASDDVIARELVPLETLYTSFIPKEVFACGFYNETILDGGESRATRTATGRRSTRPGSIAHTQDDWGSTTKVARITLKPDNGTVTTTTSI